MAWREAIDEQGKKSVLRKVLRDIVQAGLSASLVKVLSYRAVEMAMRG